MSERVCLECGGVLRWTDESIPVEFRGHEYLVSGIGHKVCDSCGERYFSLAAGKDLQKRAATQARRERGLLEPQEIRYLRRKILGLNQDEFEKLLGVGAKTVTRWENGTVFQHGSTDVLMRALIATPYIADILVRGQVSCERGTHQDNVVQQRRVACGESYERVDMDGISGAVDNDFAFAA